MNLEKTDVSFFTRTSDAWESMLRDARNANRTIDFEQYIFTHDVIGERFLEVFRQKISEGVKVRMICDTVGSYGFYRSSVPDELRSMGVEIKFFNPVSPWRIYNFTANFFRDHRKILVVDGKIGHIGGVCIKDSMAHWRDTQVRVVGQVVTRMLDNFETMWRHAGKSFSIKFPRDDKLEHDYYLIINSPWFGQRHIYHTLIEKVKTAKRYIYLTTPYFIPEIKLFRALHAAAKRGVDVRLIVPQYPDHFFINHARESYFTMALKAGIKIFIYTPVMIHAKTVVIDEFWATVGSFNLDSLSFFYNHEANIVSADPIFAQTVKSHFLKDTESCEEVKYEVWIRRPFLKKFLELLTWPFHGIM